MAELAAAIQRRIDRQEEIRRSMRRRAYSPVVHLDTRGLDPRGAPIRCNASAYTPDVDDGPLVTCLRCLRALLEDANA